MKRKISDSEFEYGIYEVYYDENGIVQGCTENSMVPTVDNPEGLKHEIEIMLKAFDQEILEYKEE